MRGALTRVGIVAVLTGLVVVPSAGARARTRVGSAGRAELSIGRAEWAILRAVEADSRPETAWVEHCRRLSRAEVTCTLVEEVSLPPTSEGAEVIETREGRSTATLHTHPSYYIRVQAE
jgi:hypothetical protein